MFILNSCLINTKGLEITKASKFPIGGLQAEDERIFTNHSFTISKNDMIYLCSDGYADQFGGKDGKKFMEKNLLIENQVLPIDKQKEVFQKTINNWKGNLKQIDDILLNWDKNYLIKPAL
jgi:sigma-B regulation protein RsbU (phosphoserine phosphatase)